MRYVRICLDEHLNLKSKEVIPVKVVAEKYKDSIDPRVYQALMEWEVGGE